MTCTPFRKDEKKNEKKNEKILIFGGKLWYVLARRVTDRRKHDQGGKGGEISSSFPDRGIEGALQGRTVLPLDGGGMARSPVRSIDEAVRFLACDPNTLQQRTFHSYLL